MKWDSGYIYEDTNFSEEPKENFKVVLEKIKSYVDNSESQDKSLLDLGCASGEFIHYVIKNFPQMKCTGLDFNEDLIMLAQNHSSLKEATFRTGDIPNLELNQKFDIVSMIGVLTCFDDFEQILDRMLAHINPGGKIYIVSIFNDDDIDVRLKFRNNAKSSDWQVGYNLFPLQRLVSYAKERGAMDVTSTEIELPFDLTKKEDPLRSWTTKVEGEGRYSLNGLMLLYKLKCVEITL